MLEFMIPDFNSINIRFSEFHFKSRFDGFTYSLS